MLRVMRVRKYHSLHSMHSWWKTQDFSKIESGPNYTTAAYALVKATLRLGLRAPFVARNKDKVSKQYFSNSFPLKNCNELFTFSLVAIQLPDTDIGTAFQPKGIKLSIRPQLRIADLFFTLIWDQLTSS